MPLRLLIAAVLALALFAPDGAKEGRRGNTFYRNGRYAAAARAYRAGLEAREGADGTVTVRLWDNLGLALHRLGRYEEAQEAFERARPAARTPDGQAQAAYNAGNNAAAQGRLEEALASYREALLADPTHADARFNYEYVKRRLQQRGPSQPPPSKDVEPSAYARRLKRRAERLIAQHRYRAAHELMARGLQQDSTVRAYQGFIGRLRDVAQIDSTENAP